MSKAARTETVRALEWGDGELRILDQRKLPAAETWIRARGVEPVAHAIETLAVRGAPVIGIAAAYGVALAAITPKATPEKVRAAIARLARTRPTGYNLFHALEDHAAHIGTGRSGIPGETGAPRRADSPRRQPLVPVDGVGGTDSAGRG